jgi:hypothetical protein
MKMHALWCGESKRQRFGISHQAEQYCHTNIVILSNITNLSQLTVSVYGQAMHIKSNLPTKICVVCGRPFSWRKKWKKNWSEVKYCSDACRRRRAACSIRDSVRSLTETA